MERLVFRLLASEDVCWHLVIGGGGVAVLPTDALPRGGVPHQVVVLLLEGAQLALHLALDEDEQGVGHLPLGLELPLRGHGISW